MEIINNICLAEKHIFSKIHVRGLKSIQRLDKIPKMQNKWGMGYEYLQQTRSVTYYWAMAASGKDQSSRSLWLSVGITSRMGKVDDGNARDYSKEEQKRHFSINLPP